MKKFFASIFAFGLVFGAPLATLAAVTIENQEVHECECQDQFEQTADELTTFAPTSPHPNQIQPRIEGGDGLTRIEGGTGVTRDDHSHDHDHDHDHAHQDIIPISSEIEAISDDTTSYLTYAAFGLAAVFAVLGLTMFIRNR